MRAHIKLFQDGDKLVGKFPATRAGMNAALRTLRHVPAAMIIESTSGESFAPLFVNPVAVDGLPAEFVTSSAPAIYADLMKVHHRTTVSYEQLWEAEEMRRDSATRTSEM